MAFSAQHAPAPASYTVRSGDTLSGIALADYGNAGLYPAIQAANPAKIKDPDLIYTGETLQIPASSYTPKHAAYQPKHAKPSAPAAPAHAANPVVSASAAYTAFPGAACIVTRESGGNPVAQNPVSTASGLFQDLDTTWNGYMGYAHAKDAPVAVQIEFNQQLSDYGRNLLPWAADGCPGT